MAYSAMDIEVAGYVITASDWNKIPNNFALTLPGLVDADGQIAVATGANATKKLLAMDSSDTFIHEVGGLEADVSTISTGDILVGQSAGVIGIETPMTQAQAEAGSETQVRGVTAERLKQAVDSLGIIPLTQASFARISVWG